MMKFVSSKGALSFFEYEICFCIDIFMKLQPGDDHAGKLGNPSQQPVEMNGISAFGHWSTAVLAVHREEERIHE